MRKLVFVTQQVDPAHRARGHGAELRALAARVDELVVLATARGGVLPGTPRRLFRVATKVGRGLRFEAALARELGRARSGLSRTCARSTPSSRRRSRGRSACLSCSGSRTGGRRRRCEPPSGSSAVLDVDRRSFPLDSPRSAPSATGSTSPSSRAATGRRGGAAALALGRYSPAKGLDVVLRALRRSPRPRAGRSPDRARPDALRAGARAPRPAPGAAGRASARRPGRAGRAGSTARRCPSSSRRTTCS